MSSALSIQLLHRDQINAEEWNKSIAAATNGMLYATTNYLDIMADNWSGVVVGNYEWVMPLAWRKKYFITYLYQAPFLQQGGLFGKKWPSGEVITAIENLICKNYKYAAIAINYANDPLFVNEKRESCSNFIINLNRPYYELSADYKSGFAKNVRRAQQFNFSYEITDRYVEVVGLYKDLYGERFPHVTDSDYNNFKTLCAQLKKTDSLLVRKVVDGNGLTGAIAIFFKDERRIYNIMSCTTAFGRENEANYFLYDSLINEFAGKNLLLDLEGSDIKGIADFYSSMGAINQPYFFVQYNKLPWPLSLKK